MTFLLLPLWFLGNLENSTTSVNQVPSQGPGEWSRYSVALHILLPVAGLCILWGRRDLFTKLLLQIDRSCISACCPSLSQREKLLKWASENLPSTWSSPSKTLSGGIPDLWKDGSLLCTLINMAVPGACPNPPKHWRKPPIHAQALAFKYLGIIPVFTESDFKNPFSFQQERKFLIYLQDLQQAIKKYSEEIKTLKFSNEYLTKGMGLQTGEQHRQTTFFIYTNSTSAKCSNISIYIRGPYGTQGTATVPAFYNLKSKSVLNYLQKQLKLSDKIIFKSEARKSFLKSIALDLSAFVNLERKHSENDIPIRVEMEYDRAKVIYIPKNHGIYEINMITNGELLTGSPFIVNVIENLSAVQDTIDVVEKFDNTVPSIKKKKILSRFIDCISEKILLDNASDKMEKKLPMIERKEKLCTSSSSDDTEVLLNNDKAYKTDEIVNELSSKLEKIYEHPSEHYNEIDNELRETTIPETHDIGSDCEFKCFNSLPIVSVTEITNENGDNSKTTIVFSENEHSEKDSGFFRNDSNSSLCDSLDSQDWDRVFSNYDSDLVSPSAETIQNEENEARSSLNEKPIIVNSVLKTEEDILQGSSRKKYFPELKSTKYDYSLVLDENENITSSGNSEYIRDHSAERSTEIERDEVLGLKLQGKLEQNQERPTSVVYPFFKNSSDDSLNKDKVVSQGTLADSQDINTSLLVEPQSVNGIKLLTIFNEKRSNSTLSDKLQETNVKTEEILKIPPYFKNDITERIVESALDNKSVDIEHFKIEELQHLRPKEEYLRNQYVDSLRRILEAKIHFKYDNSKVMKDLVNTTNKLKNLSREPPSEVSTKNVIASDSLNSSPTSPICPDHIAPEVAPEDKYNNKYEKLTLTEKRKFFARQLCTSLPSTNNSSISEKETEGVSYELEGVKSPLRVLSVMDTLKKTTGLNRKTSKSVPNISGLDVGSDHFFTKNLERSYEYRSGFLKTKEYWSKISSGSTSTSSGSSGRSMIPNKLKSFKDNSDLTPELHRSADDIFSISRMNFDKRIPQRYSSLNQKDFENIEFISLDERKRRLLQGRYELENLGSRFMKQKFRSNDESKTTGNQETEDLKSNVSSEQPLIAETRKAPSESIELVNEVRPPPKETHKPQVTQFRRAIMFFRKLEKSSSEAKLPFDRKSKPVELRRRLSLDYDKRKKGKPKIGGSLKLPKTSEKFSVARIYFDIMGNRRGSFKGPPNKKALSASLASLSKVDDPSKLHRDSDDSIEFSMFMNKMKPKRRKSIKSIFEIH